MRTDIVHVPDAEVDADLDHQIRSLLTRCFTKPQDAVFSVRRYFHEPCAHRWIARADDGRLAAHAGLHERVAHAGSHVFRIGGVSEVCVHPEFRGRGLVRTLLGEAHRWLRTQRIQYAVLMGDPRVYASSGYTPVSNVSCSGLPGHAAERLHLEAAQVAPIADTAWPDSDVFIPGPPF